jgi:hypothetical protein
MSDFPLCSVEDTFQVSGRGLIVAPFFSAREYRFEANQRVRVVPPSGEPFECNAFFQIPHQTPPAEILSYHCALLEVPKERVPIGSQLWLVGKEASEIKRSPPTAACSENRYQ